MTDRADWSEENRGFFIKAMVNEIDRGVYVDSGFKKASWQKIMEELNTAASTGGNSNKQPCIFTKQQCQSYYPKIKHQWTVYEMLMTNSGFGRDSDTGGPTACDSVWKAVIAAHKDAAIYRHKPFTLYEECTYIFTGKSATGKYAKSSVYTTPDNPFKMDKKRDSSDSLIQLESNSQKRPAYEDCVSSIESVTSNAKVLRLIH